MKSNHPKTKKAMKQTMKYLSMAALVVMGAILDGCSKKETVQPKEETPEVVDPVGPEEPVVEDNIVVCTTTVSFDIDETKALNEDGVKTFATGDRIAVIYKNTGNQTVKAVSESLPTGEYDHTATFTVTLTNPAEDAAVRIIYPAAMAAPFVYPGVAVDADATINYAALSSQDGTLASLSSNLDLAVYDGNLIGTSLPADPALENKLAICMYTLKNSAGEEITGAISGMTVNDGTYNYSISRSAAAGPIYVAIRPTDNATVKYTATNGSIYYSKSVTGKTYAASEMYPLGLIMAVSNIIDLSKLNGDFVATHGEVLQNTLGSNHKIFIYDKATVVLDNMTINGTDSEDYQWAGITCNGDATIILKGTNTVRGFYSHYPGIYVPAGKTLTILGEGSLVASSNGGGAGIGGGYGFGCGNIHIEGGDVTAVGGPNAAGIGGGGYSSTCGNIVIAKTAKKVQATKGLDAPYSIGPGYGSVMSATVTIGDDMTGPIGTPTFTYLNLSALAGNYVASDGTILAGTLGDNYKISFADGATVTLDGVTIEGYEYYSYDWAGITCQGNATILFKGDNTVKGFFSNYPGIYVPSGKTLTIQGSGTLKAIGSSAGAGIGGGTNISCGNICIEGGVVTAVGGSYCAGIGAGYAEATSVICGTITITGGDVTAEGGVNGAGIGSGGSWEYTSTCGDILISAGTVNATGGQLAAGIGSGSYSGCGKITISGPMTSVTATKGEFDSYYDPLFYSIGPGYHGSCGTVSIGGVTGPISTSPYTFPSL